MTDLQHVLTADALSKEQVLHILDTAEAFFEVSRRPVRKVPTLRGKTVINLFYEASTRTRTSFEIAGKRMSADVINMNVSASSVKKGETLYDTCKTLEAMHPDIVVIRHSSSGAAAYLKKNLACSVINAGDGMHAHPTQALLDAFTIRRKFGTLENLRVTICGDIAHSRVARSNIHLLKKFGCTITLSAPRTLLPRDVGTLGVNTEDSIDAALTDADIVMVLRIQRERIAGALLPSLREYSKTFGVNAKRLALAKDHALVMHPGPMNRGVEIEPEVADGPQSGVLDQVEAGVAVRMALLFLLAGTKEPQHA